MQQIQQDRAAIHNFGAERLARYRSSSTGGGGGSSSSSGGGGGGSEGGHRAAGDDISGMWSDADAFSALFANNDDGLFDSIIDGQPLSGVHDINSRSAW